MVLECRRVHRGEEGLTEERGGGAECGQPGNVGVAPLLAATQEEKAIASMVLSKGPCGSSGRSNHRRQCVRLDKAAEERGVIVGEAAGVLHIGIIRGAVDAP